MAKFVDAVPPRSGQEHDEWTKLADMAKERPGKALLAASYEHERVVKRLRARSRPPFVSPEGHIKVSMRGSTTTDDGRRGDIYLTWIPADEKEEK